MIPTLSPDMAVAMLRRLGYLMPRLGKPSQDELEIAADSYRQFFGLGADVKIPQHLALPRCGLPDVSAQVQGFAAPQVCRWPSGHTVRCDFGFATGSFDAVRVGNAFRWALNRWASVCGFRWIEEERAPNIRSRSGRIDGPGNVLAWSHLPCGADANTRLEQLYDSLDPGLTQSDSFFAGVVLHELGHALGLDHSKDKRAIMYPLMRADVLDLGGDDVRRIVGLYGATPTPAPPPPPPPPTPVHLTGTIVAGGRTYKITGEAV